MTVSVQGTGGETVVFQTRKITGDDLETNAALLDLDDIPIPSAINTAKGYTTFSQFYNDLPDNTDIQGPQGPQGPAIDSVSLAQSVDLSTITMTFGYTQNNQGYTVGTTPSFTIPAGPTGPTGTGIQFVSHDTQNHTLTFQFTDTLSDLTVDLPQGDDGPAGRSISSISKSGDVMTINYDDGSSPTQISGIRGPAGDAATVTVDSTNTLAAGASASVTETGTSNSQNRELIFNIPAGADGTDGTGFTGGSYDALTGEVTFTSNDNLGFSTGDLRGVDGVDGDDGVSVTGVNQVNSTTINFSLSDSTTTSNITLPSASASAILPSYTSNAGKVLAVNSTSSDIEWIAVSGTGTVTSVGLTGANGISFTGSPITTSGTISMTVNAATLKSHLAITFADVGSTPTTIAGYGITDAFDGVFSSLNSKPTTIAGYGITDAFSGAYSDLSGKPTIPTTVDSLTDVTVTTVADNELLAYDTTASEWINQTPAEAGFATVATSGAFTDLSTTPTTLAGYGITDAFDGAFASLSSKPTTVAGYGITDAFSGVFADLSSKPTTIAGYGITDAFSGAYADLSGKPTIPSTVSTLADVTISTVADNELLAYDTTASEWINQTPAEAGFATVATSGAFADLTGTPTTIAGYGITDAFDGAFASLTSTPTTIAGYGITDAFDGAFSSLTSKPTTVAGYGITDALTSVDLASDVGSTVLPVANGGTGLTALGSAGQVLKVNSAGTALEYATDNTGAASGADPVVMAIALG